MGIFDFLFNKKKKKSVFVDTKRRNVNKPKTKNFYDKEWFSELNAMFKEDENSDNPIWFFTQSKNGYNN